MIDRTLLSTDFEVTARRLGRKGVPHGTLEEVRELLGRRRELTTRVDESRAELRRSSEGIGRLLQQKKAEEAEEMKAKIPGLKDQIASLEAQLGETEEKVDYHLLRIPNMPSDEAPEGLTEDSNVVRSVHGYDRAAFEGRTFRPHWDIATELGIYDAERATKISGSMFALLRGQGARLLRALVEFGLELNRDRYEEYVVPHFVRTDTFTGTGHLPKFEVDAYRFRDDDLWAIPTGEVPLMGIHRGEILEASELPKRYMTYTACFRREAGSAGKDTRGMQRLHEFHKVEVLKLCTPEQVQPEFEAMLLDARRPLDLLGLPYRIVDLCCGDLTFSATRLFDLEVYAPGVDRWLEVSSVGIFSDFQARRGNIRFRPEPKAKPQFVHALNGSALATPRVWAAVIEHGQQPDGTVRIPEPLVRYMGTDVIKPLGGQLRANAR